METLKKWWGEVLFLSGFCFLVYRSKGLAEVTGKLWTTHHQEPTRAKSPKERFHVVDRL